MDDDSRASIYDDLHGGQLARQDAPNRASARRILGLVFGGLTVRSMLDVGCGLGTWMAVARELGVVEVRGLEGAWLDPTRLQVEPALVDRVDLERGFALGRRFDLALCLEVAEHLSEPAGMNLVASLSAHSDLVLFSAAVPGQGGHQHVNEQFPDYWAAHFARFGLRPVDLVRPRIWDDPSVLGWLRQNTLLFAHERALAASESLRREAEVPRPLSVVHPSMHLARLAQVERTLREHATLVHALSQGGAFVVDPEPDGRFSLRRTSPRG